MVSAIVMTLFVGVSAKDGDLLWEADFRSTTAPFNPTVLTGTADKVTITPAADGKSANFNVDGTANGGYAWGDAIETLKITESSKYTVEFAFKNTTSNGNVGVTFLTGNVADPYKSWHTFYGAASGSLGINISSSSNKGFPGVSFSQAKDADGYYSFKMEINGYYVRAYALNAAGNYVLGATYKLNTDICPDPAIALGVFGWFNNKGSASTLDIKYFKVTEGTPMTDAAWAIDYAATGLGEAYKKAWNGTLIWSANFNGDDYFKPVTDGTAAGRGTLTTTVEAEGKSVSVSGGSAAGTGFYADTVDGLAITADTQYTVEFKLKNDGQYGGAIFYGTPSYYVPANSYVSFYTGNGATDTNNTVARGGCTSTYMACGQMGSAYVKDADRALDADGFWDVKVEIDGYKVTVNYKVTSGEYKAAYTYVMDDKDAVIACGTYSYQPTAITTIKDFNVYKGLTLTNTYPPAPVEPEEPDTPDTPVVPDAPVETGDSTIALVLALIATVTLGGVMVAKKAR